MKLLTGDDLGIARDGKHIVVETESPRVVFSFTRYGNAISAHFAADKAGLRELRWKIEEFCTWAFAAMPWCRMIIGNVKKRSVEKMLGRCGFQKLMDNGCNRILVRGR
jgi:hypothetical protein